MTARRFFRCMAVFAWLLLSFCPSTVQPAYAQSSEADYLRDEATNARAFAKKKRKIAAQWQERAATARKNVKSAKNKFEKDGYLEDVTRYVKRAEEAAIDADKAEAKAVKAEADLLQVLKTLERGSSDSNSETSPPIENTVTKKTPVPTAIPVKEIIGVWTINEVGSIFVIVQEQPNLAGQAYRLEAHSGVRVWKGWYTPFEEGDINRQQDARVLLKYKPKADEMNPEIPEWARKKIEGQLEWEVELDESQVCGGAPALDMKLFPGQVKWDEKDKIVKIDGRGEARKLSLSPEEYEPEDAFATTAIRIRPPGIEQLKDDGEFVPFSPILDLMEGQLFHVDVMLPYDIAKETGDELDLEIAGLGDGGSETVVLKRGSFREGKSAIYTNYRPLFFGEAEPFLSESWFVALNEPIGKNPQRLDLDIANGESVRFIFDDTYQVLPLYKDVETYTIAKYIELGRFLKNYYGNLLLMPGIGKLHKENAHIWVNKLKNFEVLMNNHRDFPAWLRVLIAEFYLGPAWKIPELMARPDRHSYQLREKGSGTNEGSIAYDTRGTLTDKDRIGDNDKQGRFDGVVWANRYEKVTVEKLISKAWSKRAKKAFDSFRVNIVKGFYEWALSEMQISIFQFGIGVSDIYAIASGSDHYGHKLTLSQRIDVIRNVGFSNFLSYTNTHVGKMVRGELAGYQAPGDRPLTVSDVLNAVRGRNIQRHKIKLHNPAKTKNRELPETLSQRQKENAVPILAANKDSMISSQPLSCAAPPRSGASAEVGMDLALTVGSRYGENATVNQNHKAKGQKQYFQTCQIAAILHAADTDMNEISALRLMADNDEAFAQRLRTATRQKHPLVYGFSEREAHLLANLLGRETMSMPSGKVMTMKGLQNWKKKGWSIKIAIHADDVRGTSENKHAIDIINFHEDPNRCELMVTVYDNGLRSSITMPAKDLSDRVAEWPIMLHREQKGGGIPKSIRHDPEGPAKPPKALKVDEFDDKDMRRQPTIVSEEFNPLSELTINEAIDYLYPGGKGAPRLNIVDRSIHEGLLRGAPWQQPRRGGAAFSQPNIGSMRSEGDNVAIRIKEGSEPYIRWVKFPEGGGEIPLYTAPDGRWAGQERRYIDPSHLQYLDTSDAYPEWRDYRPSGGAQ